MLTLLLDGKAKGQRTATRIRATQYSKDGRDQPRQTRKRQLWTGPQNRGCYARCSRPEKPRNTEPLKLRAGCLAQNGSMGLLLYPKKKPAPRGCQTDGATLDHAEPLEDQSKVLAVPRPVVGLCNRL